MNVRGLYGKILSAINEIVIKNIDSKVSRFLRRVLGDKRHFRLTNYLNHESRLLGRYSYGNKSYDDKQTVVIMFDGNFSSPGLADILRSICSVYQWCKMNNRIFKLYFTSPFVLTDYLVPNMYDWIIDTKDLDFKNSSPFAIFSYNNFYGEKKQLELQEYSLNKLLSCHKKQIHLYSNLFCYDSYFYNNYHELFKNECRLENEIMSFQKEIGTEYITISFRFTQLLGDLKDSFGVPLPEKEKWKLIEVCINAIEPILKINKVEKAIITSDSKTFLHEVAKLPFVYLIPGEPDHINNRDNSQDVVRKAFWDTMMISRAKKAYMVRTPIMYTSGFAKRAAMIGNIQFEEILL